MMFITSRSILWLLPTLVSYAEKAHAIPLKAVSTNRILLSIAA